MKSKIETRYNFIFCPSFKGRICEKRQKNISIYVRLQYGFNGKSKVDLIDTLADLSKIKHLFYKK